jgi:lipopolysaccharide export system protein LptA
MLELDGEARLHNGSDLIESERIRFNIETSALEAGDPESGENGRVRMVIQRNGRSDPPPEPAGR